MGTHVGFALADTTLLHFTETFCICVVIRASIRAVVFECPNALISLTMGAYLSEPVTKKEIGVDEDDNFWVSSASMQGWRVSQEDAHNALLGFDDYSSLFAVYDGHGGHEVAVYTAKRLPNFIKGRKPYRMGNVHGGLIEAFVEFDRSLTERDVIRELRVIAGK